jgi:hypothetical protein
MAFLYRETDKFLQKMSAIAHSFGDAGPPADASVAQNLAPKASRLPRDVALSSLNLVRDVHLDLLNVESLSALVSIRASMKIYIGLDQVSIL